MKRVENNCLRLSVGTDDKKERTFGNRKGMEAEVHGNVTG